MRRNQDFLTLKKAGTKDGNSSNVLDHLISEQKTRSDNAVENLLQDSAQQLFGVDAKQIDINDEQVKDSLKELLIAFVAVSETDTNGKKLMNDLSSALGTSVSPGTMYPELHRLNDDGIFEQYELVRRKIYEIGDKQEAEECLLESIQAHFLIAQVLYVAAQDLENV